MSENTNYVQYKDIEAAKAAFVFGNFKFKCAICNRIHDINDEESYSWCKYNSRIISTGDDNEVIYPESYMLALDLDTFKKAFFEPHPIKSDIDAALERITEYIKIKDIIDSELGN